MSMLALQSPNLSDQLQILAGSIGVILAVFFSIFILIKIRDLSIANVFLAIYLLAFGLRIGKAIFHNYYELPGSTRNIFIALLYLVGPSIWLYTKYFCSDKNSIQRKDWVHYSLSILILAFAFWIPNDGGGSKLFLSFYNGTIIHMAIYTLLALFTYYRHLKNASDHFWMDLFLWVNLLVIVLYWLISEGIIPSYLSIAFVFSAMVIIFSTILLANLKLLKKRPMRYVKSILGKNDAAELFEKIEETMGKNQLYLNESLSLSILAESINSNGKSVSQAINQISGQNFSNYVSSHRITEAKSRLVDPKYDHLSIAAIAYDSGFKSISTFNAQFKKQEGTTAKSYRDHN